MSVKIHKLSSYFSQAPNIMRYEKMTPASFAQVQEKTFSYSPSHSPTQEETQYHSIRAYGPLMDSVFALRYKSYSADNHIEKNPSERFMDEFDGRKNCTSYLTYY